MRHITTQPRITMYCTTVWYVRAHITHELTNCYAIRYGIQQLLYHLLTYSSARYYATTYEWYAVSWSYRMMSCHVMSRHSTACPVLSYHILSSSFTSCCLSATLQVLDTNGMQNENHIARVASTWAPHACAHTHLHVYIVCYECGNATWCDVRWCEARWFRCDMMSLYTALSTLKMQRYLQYGA